MIIGDLLDETIVDNESKTDYKSKIHIVYKTIFDKSGKEKRIGKCIFGNRSYEYIFDRLSLLDDFESF